MFNELMHLWSDHAGLSAAIWIAISVVALYLARHPAHQLIHSSGRFFRYAARLAGRSLSRAEAHLVARNREVILAQGREALEQSIEREFSRVNVVVTRDLSGYPALHRAISDTIASIEDDYRVPEDSVVSIATEGLLGGAFVAIDPGGEDIFLENGDEIKHTQGSVSIIELLGKFFAN